VIKYEEKLVSNQKYIATVCSIVLIFLTAHAYGVIKRNEVWDTHEKLWYDVTVKSPNNPRGLMNYGLSQMAKGNYKVAEDYFNRTLKLAPNYSTIHVNLAILKNATNRSDEAEFHFKQAQLLDKNNPDGYYFYGQWLFEKFRYEEAKTQVESGLKLSPAHGLLLTTDR
jgi:Tfp pilus assembly protein PilF